MNEWSDLSTSNEEFYSNKFLSVNNEDIRKLSSNNSSITSLNTSKSSLNSKIYNKYDQINTLLSLQTERLKNILSEFKEY